MWRYGKLGHHLTPHVVDHSSLANNKTMKFNEIPYELYNIVIYIVYINRQESLIANGTGIHAFV